MACPANLNFAELNHYYFFIAATSSRTFFSFFLSAGNRPYMFPGALIAGRAYRHQLQRRHAWLESHT
jgi:hypothetical protein